jgi:O-antigen/teichoic acid export membrane protein/glycosyltransferase involved in cell wall biosynthesis
MPPWKAATLTIGTKAYWIIGAMIATLVTARFLGAPGRGVIAAATSWVYLFVTFGHLSLANVIVYLAARDGRARLGVIAGSAMAITGAVTLVGWAIVATLHLGTHGAIFEHIPVPVLMLAFAALPLLLWMESINSLLVVIGDLKRLNLAQAAGTTAGIVLVVLAVAGFRKGVTAAMIAALASYAVVVGLGLARIRSESGPLSVSRAVVAELLQGSLRLHLSAVGTFFFTHAAVILLNHFRPVKEVGYFQLAMQLTVAVQIVPMAVAVVASSLVARDGADRAWPEHRRLIVQTMLYAAAAAAAAYLLAPLLVGLLAGRAFAPAVPIVRILGLSVLGMSLGTVMAPQWVARGYFLQSSLLSLAGVAVALVGNWLFVPRHGMYGCAWVMVASYSVHLVGNGLFAWWIERRLGSRPTVHAIPTSAAPTAAGSLYLCYFGLQEPLVQTQVLPYLRELAGRGLRMALLTFEPDPDTRWTAASIAEWKARLSRDGIEWHWRRYHRWPSLPATVFDIVAGAAHAVTIARRRRLALLHGRSDVGATIGALAKPFTGARLIFDIRGFLAEEYAEAGRWTPGGFVFRLVKAAERGLHRSADGVVVLTERARETLFPAGPLRGQPVEVIPCCVDRTRFDGPVPSEREARRRQLGIADRLVLVYAGSLGGAHLARETAAFLAAAREVDPRVYALVLTPESPAGMIDALEAAGLGPADYRVTAALPEEVPHYLRAADGGLALVRPSFARRSMSPTKFAEYLAAGLPVVVTAGVGDLDAQVEERRVGMLLRRFDRDAYLAAFRALKELRRDPQLPIRCRDLARTRYDLHTVGAERYHRLYERLLRPSAVRRIRVLALASYPVEAAASRYRIVQFIAPLAARSIDVRFLPFLTPSQFAALYEPRRFLWRLPRVALRLLGRLAALRHAARADVVFVQREAALFGPPLTEWIAARILRRPLILDLDDATYVPSTSPVYGRLATWLKGTGKTDRLIRWARVVTCGNPTIAAHVRSRGAEAVLVPTVVDSAVFHPDRRGNETPCIGWIGTHSTYPFLERLLPVFARLARDVPFRLTIVGSGRRDIQVPGVEVDMRPWQLTREAEDFRSLDIGVYPMPEEPWTAGKSGLKAVQYMMSGVASVISPVGVCETLGIPGETHLTAVDSTEWVEALRRLITDADVRRRIGRAARAFAERHYSLEPQADALASVIRATATGGMGQPAPAGPSPMAVAASTDAE